MRIHALAVGLAVGCFLAAPASCAPAQAAGPAEKAEKSAASTQKRDNWEVQLEYLDARFFKNRDVNSYNVHFFQVAHKCWALTIHRGLTFSRPLGYTSEYGYDEDSQAVGLGPAVMLRWTQKISGKFSASWDASGSLMVYNRAHPAHGRAFGFLWRTGPRLIWNYADNGSFSLGWSIAHSSNGMGTHNPGYNGVGFSLGFSHAF